MSYKKIFSYDDLDILSKEYAKIIANKYEELNKDKNIILLTEQEYRELLYNAIDKISDVARCLGTYVSGKKRGGRCQASPQPNSKYCLQHKNQGSENKQQQEPVSEAVENVIENSEAMKKAIKKAAEKIAIDLIKKASLND
jgi:hypothetical protein